MAVASRALPEADAHLREALSVFTAIDARFEAARTRLDLADLERCRRDEAAAAAHRGEARRLFEALGLPAQVAAVDRLAAGAGATRAPRLPAGAPALAEGVDAVDDQTGRPPGDGSTGESPDQVTRGVGKTPAATDARRGRGTRARRR